jgi:hypothetical protein
MSSPTGSSNRREVRAGSVDGCSSPRVPLAPEERLVRGSRIRLRTPVRRASPRGL